jgi:hypothetical protein
MTRLRAAKNNAVWMSLERLLIGMHAKRARRNNGIPMTRLRTHVKNNAVWMSLERLWMRRDAKRAGRNKALGIPMTRLRSQRTLVCTRGKRYALVRTASSRA